MGGRRGWWGGRRAPGVPPSAAPGHANLDALATAVGEKCCFSLTFRQAAHLR